MAERELAEHLRDLVVPYLLDEEVDYFEASTMDEDWADLIALSRDAARAYGITIPPELAVA